MKLYHVTPTQNVSNIKKHGLRPSTRKGFSSYVDVHASLKTGHLFFVDSLDGIGDLLTTLAVTQSTPAEWTILEINAPDNYPVFLETELDPNACGVFTEFLVSTVSVPAARIRILGTIQSGYQDEVFSWGMLSTVIPSPKDIPESEMGEILKGSRKALFWSEYHGEEVPEEFKESQEE